MPRPIRCNRIVVANAIILIRVRRVVRIRINIGQGRWIPCSVEIERPICIVTAVVHRIRAEVVIADLRPSAGHASIRRCGNIRKIHFVNVRARRSFENRSPNERRRRGYSRTDLIVANAARALNARCTSRSGIALTSTISIAKAIAGRNAIDVDLAGRDIRTRSRRTGEITSDTRSGTRRIAANSIGAKARRTLSIRRTRRSIRCRQASARSIAIEAAFIVRVGIDGDISANAITTTALFCRRTRHA